MYENIKNRYFMTYTTLERDTFTDKLEKDIEEYNLIFWEVK